MVRKWLWDKRERQNQRAAYERKQQRIQEAMEYNQLFVVTRETRPRDDDHGEPLMAPKIFEVIKVPRMQRN